MTLYKYSFPLLIILIVFSCDNGCPEVDDKEKVKQNTIVNEKKGEDKTNDSGASFFEIDNKLKGLMDGEDWEYGSAVFSEEEIFGEKSFDLTLTKYISDLCGFNYLKTQKISVNMPVLKLGKYSLNDLYEMDGISGIFIRDPKYKKEAGLMGWIVEKGSIEITKISSDRQVIEGYIKAYIDEDFDLEGSFKAKRCRL